MNLRKEPVLFVVALALAAFVWSRRDAVDLKQAMYAKPKTKSFTPVDSPLVVLAGPEGRTASRDLFREPTEAVPLPPRELPYPALAALPVVALPLDPGPAAPVWYQLRIVDPTPVTHSFATAPADDGAAATAAEDPENGTPQPAEQDPGDGRGGIPEALMIERFDRVWIDGAQAPLFGLIGNQDKLDLPATGPFPATIEFVQVSRLSGNAIGPLTLAPERVDKIALADSLDNHIALRKRDLGEGAPSLPAREAFLGEMIEHARQHDRLWREAVAQAQQIFDIATAAGQAEVGYRSLLSVYRAKGDLAAELALYENQTGEAAELPARWREQAHLEWQLGMYDDAEQHLRRALAGAPNDPRANAMAARFLLERGRAGEALAYAERGANNRAKIDGEERRYELHATHVAALLAVGRTDDAMLAQSRISGASAGRSAYLRGAVHYARGELDQAVEQFERAADELGTLDAILGLGACALRQGRWDDCERLLRRVADDAPALRARALAGLGLLYERTAHAAESRSALEAAERAAPHDPYVLYLLGRRLRLDGEPEAAVAMQRRALSERDELAESLAETTRALLARAEVAEGDAAELLARSVRYADRLVELDRTRSEYLPFIELQGYVLALVGDVSGARRAFLDGAERGSAFCQLGIALLDYRQGRVGGARTALSLVANDAQRPAEVREYARHVIELIDDHAGKEQVRDPFARSEAGALWSQSGALRPTVVDEQLVFRGNTGRGGEESSVGRTVRVADLIAVEVDMTVAADAATTTFAGLRVAKTASSGTAFRIDFGVRSYGARRQLELLIEDGRPRDGESNDPILVAVDPGAGVETRLGLELVPDADPASQRMTLRASWNGRVVHERVLQTVNRRSATEVSTMLVAQGMPAHVIFDDYRLVRRKELR